MTFRWFLSYSTPYAKNITIVEWVDCFPQKFSTCLLRLASACYFQANKRSAVEEQWRVEHPYLVANWTPQSLHRYTGRLEARKFGERSRLWKESRQTQCWPLHPLTLSWGAPLLASAARPLLTRRRSRMITMSWQQRTSLHLHSPGCNPPFRVGGIAWWKIPFGPWAARSRSEGRKWTSTSFVNVERSFVSRVKSKRIMVWHVRKQCTPQKLCTIACMPVKSKWLLLRSIRV